MSRSSHIPTAATPWASSCRQALTLEQASRWLHERAHDHDEDEAHGEDGAAPEGGGGDSSDDARGR